VQWYAEEWLDEEGRERDEVIKMPVERGWGIWCQADVLARRVWERKKKGEGKGVGEVIGEEESLRVLGWLYEARKIGGIECDPELDEI
jgi:hypothetical protein